MIREYKIVTWNANGLAQRSQELKVFFNEHNMDILLISETHFTEKVISFTTRNTQVDGLTVAQPFNCKK